MARISGVDLPREKRVEIGLTYIYGIGRVTSNRILAQANVNPDTRVRDLTDEEVARIRDVIDETVTVEGDLRREIALNIKRLQEIGCYRGIRHRKGLPVLAKIDSSNIIIEAIKPCEDSEKAYIVRLYESEGSYTNAVFDAADCATKVEVTNMLEEVQSELAGVKNISLTFRPFEIKTLKVSY